jgi:hypothetical protein
LPLGASLDDIEPRWSSPTRRRCCAIAIAEASDEPLDVPGAAADLKVSRVLDSRTVWCSRRSPTRRVALDVDSVALMGMHADMPARARVTALTPRGTGVIQGFTLSVQIARLLKALTMRQVRSVRGGMGWGSVGRR